MSNASEPEPEQSPEFQRFDAFMQKLVKVPVSEVQKLEAKQKQAQAKKAKQTD